MTWVRTPVLVLLGLSLWLAGPAYAQLAGGQQEATKILNGMAPDTLAKVQSLALLLQQGIKDGKISDHDIKQGLLSGHLGEKLKGLNPEAGQLLHDISEASKEGKGPGEDSLMPLLGGLGISPN